ncbi:MAG: CidA/LrgA family protein [Eubacteriales bacterium]|nr:CidA/LrgA family protein [Eubacteriales bacterium]
MKYLKQFGIIIAFSFAGEIFHHLIPLSIPASIYGIILLFAALETGVVKADSIRETSLFLIEIMPIMFIPSAVGLIDVWPILQTAWLQYLTVTVVTTILVMAAAGRVTQAIIRRKQKKEGSKHA